MPKLMTSGKASQATTALLFSLLVQFIIRVFRFLALVRRMQRVVGYIFGGAWWGFLLNFAAYCVAAHVRAPFSSWPVSLQGAHFSHLLNPLSFRFIETIKASFICSYDRPGQTILMIWGRKRNNRT